MYCPAPNPRSLCRCQGRYRTPSVTCTRHALQRPERWPVSVGSTRGGRQRTLSGRPSAASSELLESGGGGQRGGRCAQHRTRPCTPAPEHYAMYSRADRRKHHGGLPMHTRACKHPVQQGCHRRPCEQAPRLRYRCVAGRGATCAHRPNHVKTASPAQRHPHRHALPAAAVHLNLARPTPAGAASPSAQMHTWERLLSAAMSPRRFTSRTACLGHVPSRLKRTRRDPARHRHIVPDLVCSALAVVHAA